MRFPTPMTSMIQGGDFGQRFAEPHGPHLQKKLSTMITRPFSLLTGLLAALFLFQSCSPFTKVYSEEEPGVNLYKYHTYNWLDNAETRQGNQGPEGLPAAAHDQIRKAVGEKMGQMGFKPCDQNPDLVLHYHVVVKNEVMYVHDWSCEGQSESGNRYDRCNRVRPVYYREGTLIVDFMDTQNTTQVWRGAAVGVLMNSAPAEVNARIKEAVQAIFKKFPGQPMAHTAP